MPDLNKPTMFFFNQHRPESIHTWDWKTSPNWGQIQKAVNHVLSYDLKPVFIDFETGDDFHAVMIAPEGFTPEIAKMQFDKSDVFFPEREW